METYLLVVIYEMTSLLESAFHQLEILGGVLAYGHSILKLTGNDGYFIKRAQIFRDIYVHKT